MDLFRRKKGKIRLSSDFLTRESSKEELEALFSVFFPVYLEPRNNKQFYDEIVLWGYSDFFDEVEDSSDAAEYTPTLMKLKNNKCIVTEFKKQTQQLCKKEEE